MSLYNFNNNNYNEDDFQYQEDYSQVDLVIEDSHAIIEKYFQIALNAQSESELYAAITELHNVVEVNTTKAILYDQVQDTVAILSSYGDSIDY